jgi:2-phosphosulfolactate phosphatase
VRFERVALDECVNVSGIVVVIDVLRAFSTAAYAFGAGAEKIILTDSVEEAFSLRKLYPSMFLVGEVDGLPIEGFDFGNSPTVIAEQHQVGKQLVQRTSAGTKGVVCSQKADLLLASSFCCAAATCRYISKNCGNEAMVTFVVTGKHDGGWGDEDEACADYIESLMKGNESDGRSYTQRVWDSRDGRKFLDENEPNFPRTDMEYCTAVNRFDFAMRVERQNKLLVMKSIVS